MTSTSISTSADVRIITDGGELVSYAEYGDDTDRAWSAFTAAIETLRDGEIAQLIEGDLIAAEHNPEYDGPAALDVAHYC